MCNDVGFGIVQAKALALREMLLRINHRITGHRLLRGGVTIGGAHLKSLPSPKEISAIESNFLELVQLIKNQTIVVDRFTGTAILNIDDVRDLGVVGVVARASGLNFDGRESHPLGKPITNFNSALAKNGDVMARLDVRIAEVETSLLILTDYCSRPGKLETVNTIKTKDISKTKSGTGIVEGWRGIITHRIEINKDQQVTRARTIDPSFFNWPALAVALSETIVPDFPLANKSFNLSYAGNDL
jgi:Ni,Fe-hydrogenase III large subunit